MDTLLLMMFLGLRKLGNICCGHKMFLNILCPEACFSKDPEPFRARKAIFSSTVSKNGEVYTPETSCIKELLFKIRMRE